MRRLTWVLCSLLLLAGIFPPTNGIATSAVALAERPRTTAANVQAAPDPRYFAETGFRISDDKFWDYFNKRGGIRTFGYPVSRKFTLLGSPVQFFQRRVMQLQSDGTVGQLNLLDREVMPYNVIQGAVLPSFDQNIANQAPAVGSPGYATAVITFVKNKAPDTWNNIPTAFYRTFATTVSFSDAYPDGNGDPNWMPGVNLEMWGVPTSAPTYDPNNRNFAYLRFQRGVMHYDQATGLTQGLLLGDYFKSIITGNNLPPDLDSQAKGSRFYKQYNNAAPNGLNRPGELPNTNMKDAFEADGPLTSPSPAPVSDSTPNPTSTPTPVASPPSLTAFGYGMQAHLPFQDQARIFGLIRNAGFGWVKQQIRWSDMEKSEGKIDWEITDAIANNAQHYGINVLFSIVTAPAWSRRAGGVDGPPDDLNKLGNFVAALAQRYKGKVQAYEIWNEQNFSREWGGGRINAGDYVEMLKVAYNRIKAVDPNAIVVSGALTPTGWNDPNVAVDDLIYFEQMYTYNNGEIKKYYDVVGAHPGGYNNPPDDTPDHRTVPSTTFKGHWSFYFDRIKQLREVMVKWGDTDKKIWCTEFGWSTNNLAPGYEYGRDNSDMDQARYIVRAFEKAKQWGWVGAMFIWNLNFSTAVPPTDEKYPFSIINSDWSPRPAYSAVKDMPK
ncbi:MAG: endo-1,4-beta-xylanase [Chloroflexi bacterium]|nr:endo-1,4-beta-xylanase [Chloroflexota bacterium]MCL5076239.1 endo-1,4-beta-xylanase [Chloroflexota bacterium]